MDCLSTRTRYEASRPECLVLNDVGFTVLWFVHNVALLLKRFDQGGASMVRVRVVNHHVFRLTCFGERDDLLMSGVRRKRKLFSLERNVNPLTVYFDGPGLKKVASTRILGLIAGEENSVLVVMS